MIDTIAWNMAKVFTKMFKSLKEAVWYKGLDELSDQLMSQWIAAKQLDPNVQCLEQAGLAKSLGKNADLIKEVLERMREKGLVKRHELYPTCWRFL